MTHETSLRDWLDEALRPGETYRNFTTFDVLELVPPGEPTVSYLSRRYRVLRFPEGFLEEVARDVGPENAGALLQAAAPTDLKVTRGEFGELLATELWEVFRGFEVPVPKLRFKISADQTQPLTDILGFRLRDEGRLEVCFCEVKLRTVGASDAGVDAYYQLDQACQDRFLDILTFVGARLQEANSPWYAPFREYLRSRAEATQERFGIVLVFEFDSWRERVLERLQEILPGLEPLSIHAVRIAGVASLVRSVFASIGIGVTETDD